MMSNDLSPEMLAMLDNEQRIIQAGRRETRRIKIEPNDTWTIRFMPYEFADRSFFLRIANHWVMRHPFWCPRHSAPEIGGDPNAQCELCDETDAMTRDTDPTVRTAGLRGSATQQWLMYCWVFERDLAKDRGNPEVVESAEERWTPYEFMHNKFGFEEFIEIFRRNLRSRNKINILDPINGLNFYAKQTTKGIKLTPDISLSPIADCSDEEIQQILDYANSKIKPQRFTPLNDSQIESALVKLQESIRFIQQQPARNTQNSLPAKSAPRVQRFSQSAPQQPQRTSLASSIGRLPTGQAVRRAPVEPVDDQPAAQADDVPYDFPDQQQVAEQPVAQEQRRVVSRQQTLPMAPQAERQNAPRVAPPATPVSRTVTQRQVSQPLQSAAPSALPPKASTEPASRASIADRLRSRQPAPARTTAPLPQAANQGQQVASSIEDADNVTDEANDPAPPAEQLPDMQQVTDAPDGQDDAPPPPVSATGGDSRGKLSAKLIAGISRVSRNQ